MSALDEFLGTATNVLGVKSIADFYVQSQQLKIQKGLADSQNTIDQLKASTAMMQTQNENLLRQVELEKAKQSGLFDFNFASFDTKKIATYALIAGGVFLAYRMFK